MNHATLNMRFQNRSTAGQQLAKKLISYANRPEVMVLALPRGGVPVAYEISEALHVPLDVLIVRKLGVPEHEELAMGAIASGGAQVLNQDIVEARHLSEVVIAEVMEMEQRELERRERLYRDNLPALDLRQRTVILVDDGLATGATMRAAIQAVRQQQADRLVVAVPVAAPEVCQEIAAQVDEMVCLKTPSPFSSVGMWYENFSQTSDEEVHDLLRNPTV